jgi:hypothetical protein
MRFSEVLGAIAGGLTGASIGFVGGINLIGYLTQSNLSGLIAIFICVPVGVVVGGFGGYHLAHRRNPNR